jgi:restriction endonuclease Mrr
MTEQFHYPPEVFNLLTDTIPLLCRGKKDVILFFQGAGVAKEDLADIRHILHSNPTSTNKYEIARTVLTKVNTRGDSGLRVRREIIKRVVEFEEFSICWPADQLKAKGLVSSLREVVNKKDSFTRMKQERDAEREQVLARQHADQAAAAKKRASIQEVSNRLSALFGMDDKPHERGKLLETVLNDLFKAYGIHIHEDFRRKDPDSATVVEQIDGVIGLDGVIHLVEMKWLKGAVGMPEFSQHLVRLFNRANVNGIFIATNGYTEPVIKECINALNNKTVFLCSLKEIVMLLQREGDLIAFLKRKAHSAIIEKNPYLEILT